MGSAIGETADNNPRVNFLWISFFGLPIEPYSSMGVAGAGVRIKHTLREPNSCFEASSFLGAQQQQKKKKKIRFR